MYKEILLKEIQENLKSFRFIIALLLCIILIPLGFYVSHQDYEKQLANYQELVKINDEKMREFDRADLEFQAAGCRPPSALSIFANGLEWHIPNTILTHGVEGAQLKQHRGIDNPESLLFGRIDLLFIVNFVISLLAILFAFNAITEEKERGTLSLIHSNSLAKHTTLVGKLIGNFIAFLVPLILGLLVGFLVLSMISKSVLFSSEQLLRIGIMLLFNIIACAVFFNMGLFISTLTYRSITSILTLLFLWVIFALTLPKLSPMLAEIIYPIHSQQVVNVQKKMVSESFEEEKTNRQDELIKHIFGDEGTHMYSGITADTEITDELALRYLWRNKTRLENIQKVKGYLHMNKEYIIQNKKLEAEFDKKTREAITTIEIEYDNQRSTQSKITRFISRISPVSCYTYLMAELSNTGILQLENLQQEARTFQQAFVESYYDKIHHITYGHGGSTTSVDKIDYDNLPRFKHSNVRLNDVLGFVWIDMLLLCLYNLLFFSAAYVTFLRYDVR